MKNKLKLISVILLFALSCGTLLLFGGCTDREEEVPWYEDFDNLEFVYEDERSEEKYFSYVYSHQGDILFHYTYEETNTREFIPNVKILHKGVEQKFYTRVSTRESFSYSSHGMEPESIDYEHPYSVGKIVDWGAYRVMLEFYLNVDLVNRPGHGEIEYKNQFSGEQIYITVYRGDKK